MIGNWVRLSLLPLLLAAGLTACESGAVQPGIVSTSAATPGAANGSLAAVGGSGRVVSINEISLRGAGGGSGNGGLIGGMAGAAGGAALGAASSGYSVAGMLVGALLGAVGGAIAGSIIDGDSGAGRGIEVVVQRDNGQKVTVAQRDDGDVQLGDRVRIVQDRQGVAKVVRDGS
ncbi:MAG: hypothetical protein EPO55_10645 [Reyranella sp.]|uniref:hypothetical protein n=1 Tax=Reyranella sp. TaxID=1929291 RepID=UPI0012048AD6|nr:hypothetical protein [Reyranella sp.]TAJ39939.1 MAG: hypothetical protein EPO55_10645 [Reyranella sp.]